MEILINSIIGKRLERLIFIRVQLLKPQPSIRGVREPEPQLCRGEREPEPQLCRGEREPEPQPSIRGEREQVGQDRRAARHQPQHQGDHHSQKEVDDENLT